VSSLAKLAISDHDDVLLIGSDTKEGEICAEQLAELIENEFECNVQIRKVEGLQTIDPQAFRRRGVPELFRVLDRYAESLTGGDELILNVTGGFKAVVPYVTLYAMSKRYRVIYLFETAPKLIDLPPAPLSFDWNRVATVSDALLKLQRDELINSTEFERLIEHVSYDEKEWLECLWDRGDDLVWLSAFGQILASAMSSSEGVQVLLSPAASKTFERSTGAVREQYQFMLSRVSNPLQRAQHMHTIHGSDLLIWKPGRTAERMEYFLEKGKIYVCALHQHEYTHSSRSNYGTDTFVPYTSSATTEVTQHELEVSFGNRLNAAEEELAATNALFAEATLQLESTEKRVAEAGRIAVKTQEEAVQARQELNEAQERIAHLENALAQLRLPWWRRLFNK
jgi:putative CRISPR-associated protein (TIGR02619 family)